MPLKRTVATAGLGIAALLLAACGGGGGDPLGGGSAASPSAAASGSAGSAPIVVGSAGFTESAILAEIYSQALTAKGIASSTKLDIGAREVYIKALQDKSISVVPEYTGNLLLNFDKAASATTAEEIEAALPQALPADLKTLKPAKAADQDVYVVTKEYAAAKGIASLADLKKVASEVTLGGPPELETRAYGPPGLEKIYGAKIKDFKPYPSPAVKTKDLLDGKIQLATYFTTESVIADNGLVALQDPNAMILPQNVVPLVRAEVAENTAAVSTIEAVQAALTTEELTALNKRVDAERQEPKQVAADYLKEKGLG
jgi:osmoprotectant transport system substrate-binding protein